MGLLPTGPCSDVYVSLRRGAVVVRMAAEGVQLRGMVVDARKAAIFLQVAIGGRAVRVPQSLFNPLDS